MACCPRGCPVSSDRFAFRCFGRCWAAARLSILESFADKNGSGVGIRGFLPNESGVELLQQLLGRDLPWIAVSYEHIETSESVLAFVHERLAAKALSLLVKVDYEDLRLAFSGEVTTPAQRRCLDDIIEAATERAGGRIAVTDEVTLYEPSRTALERRSSPSDSVLPASQIFTIIVSGERPFVRDNLGNR